MPDRDVAVRWEVAADESFATSLRRRRRDGDRRRCAQRARRRRPLDDDAALLVPVPRRRSTSARSGAPAGAGRRASIELTLRQRVVPELRGRVLRRAPRPRRAGAGLRRLARRLHLRGGRRGIRRRGRALPRHRRGRRPRRLPPALRPLQDRRRPAGRAPRLPVVRHLGRPRGDEQLRRADVRRTRRSAAFAARRAAAYRAWWEHQPVRLPAPTALDATRRPSTGSTATPLGRPRSGWRCSTAASTAPTSACDGPSAVGRRARSLDDPARTMLGTAQEQWLATTFGTLGHDVERPRQPDRAQPTCASPAPCSTPTSGTATRPHASGSCRRSPAPATNVVVLTGDIHAALVGRCTSATGPSASNWCRRRSAPDRSIDAAYQPLVRLLPDIVDAELGPPRLLPAHRHPDRVGGRAAPGRRRPPADSPVAAGAATGSAPGRTPSNESDGARRRGRLGEARRAAERPRRRRAVDGTWGIKHAPVSCPFGSTGLRLRSANDPHSVRRGSRRRPPSFLASLALVGAAPGSVGAAGSATMDASKALTQNFDTLAASGTGSWSDARRRAASSSRGPTATRRTRPATAVGHRGTPTASGPARAERAFGAGAQRQRAVDPRLPVHQRHRRDDHLACRCATSASSGGSAVRTPRSPRSIDVRLQHPRHRPGHRDATRLSPVV